MCKAIEDMRTEARDEGSIIAAVSVAMDFGKTRNEAIEYVSEKFGKTPEEVKEYLRQS